jgi:DNA replication protein DnaC
MAFDAIYHIRAEDELRQRRVTNSKLLDARRLEMETKFPEFVKLRVKIASTGAKLAATVFDSDAVSKVESIQAEHIAASARMKELLMNAKHSPEYLDIIYSCKTCQDTGVAGFARCECYINTVKRLAAEGINSTSQLTLTGFETFEIELYPDVADKEYGFNIREAMRNNLLHCTEYAQNFRLPNEGLLLIGGTGLGKTHLSLAIAGAVLSSGFNAVYGSAPDFFRKIQDENFGREIGRTMESLQAAELLVLDDIGSECDTAFNVSTFYNLLNSRTNSGNPTIISTNYTMEELKGRYGTRITSRLMIMRILRFYGNDIRLLKRKFR